MADPKDQDPNPPAEESSGLPFKRRDFAETMSSNSSYDDFTNKKMKLMNISHETYISVADNTEKDLLPPQDFTCASDEKEMQIGEENPLTKSQEKTATSSPTQKQACNDVASSGDLIAQCLLKEGNTQFKNWNYDALASSFSFLPTDCEMSDLFLKKKALGQPVRALTVPEECSLQRIFSSHPRYLPGNPKEDHWYFYCRKLDNQVTTQNLWTQIGKENVLDEENDDAIVGIKRSFSLIEQEEESNDILLSDEKAEPRYNWFMDEISLPLTVADSDWLMCHVFREKVSENVTPITESESESESE